MSVIKLTIAATVLWAGVAAFLLARIDSVGILSDIYQIKSHLEGNIAKIGATLEKIEVTVDDIEAYTQ